MKIITTVRELHNGLSEPVLKPLGLVPTMGALHAGHVSLVKQAKKECPRVVVSIFVNPTQFNDKNDLKRYPRTPDTDLALLKKHLAKDDIVFIPEEKEIYPEPDTRIFSFGNLDNVMEALHRPGHFNGVGQVVSRLFRIVNPDKAYFGLKDFQQLAVIRSLVRQLDLKVNIIACPIIREPDGLAMSSRNRLLDDDTRNRAPVIFKTIAEAAVLFREKGVAETKKYVNSCINREKGFEVEYFEIVDDTELVPIVNRQEIKNEREYFACIAVRAGKVRLIDNVKIPLM